MNGSEPISGNLGRVDALEILICDFDRGKIDRVENLDQRTGCDEFEKNT